MTEPNTVAMRVNKPSSLMTIANDALVNGQSSYRQFVEKMAAFADIAVPPPAPLPLEFSWQGEYVTLAGPALPKQFIEERLAALGAHVSTRTSNEIVVVMTNKAYRSKPTQEVGAILSTKVCFPLEKKKKKKPFLFLSLLHQCTIVDAAYFDQAREEVEPFVLRKPSMKRKRGGKVMGPKRKRAKWEKRNKAFLTKVNGFQLFAIEMWRTVAGTLPERNKEIGQRWKALGDVEQDVFRERAKVLRKSDLARKEFLAALARANEEALHVEEEEEEGEEHFDMEDSDEEDSEMAVGDFEMEEEDFEIDQFFDFSSYD